jgi:hypothetical protein
MSLQLINNGDLGEVARNKINLAIEALNTLLTVDSYSMVVYDNSPTITGVGTDTEACDAITMGSSHTVYFTKGSGNTDNGSIEMGDSVYSDSNLTTPLSNNYYGAVITMMNKSIYIVGGIADMVNDCSGGVVGGNFNAWDNYVDATGEADASTACSSIMSGTQHVLYITKDPNNYGGDSTPESNDQLFTDEMKMMQVPNGYYGWDDAGIQKSVNVSGGTIMSIDDCGGGAGGDFIQAWDQDPMMASGTAMATDACNAIYMGSSHDLYIQKDPMNMGGSSVPEVNDQLFTDSMLTNPAPMNWYGWNDMMMAQNKSINIGMNGVISQIDNC